VMLEDTGLPLLRSGENLFQVARFQLSGANAFMQRSGLDLQPGALDRLLSSAAQLDDTPGRVRPITLNVIGYVLASGKAVAPSLNAGTLVRQYIEQTLGQPAIRDHAPRMLEQMITEQGTKRPCSEEDLAAKANLRRAEVRAVLNCLCNAGLARPLDPAQGLWELSHDFIAGAVARFLGRRRGQALRRAGAAAPALLAVAALGGAGAMAWYHSSPEYIRTKLADYDVLTKLDTNGLAALATSKLGDEQLSKVMTLLARLGHLQTLSLRETQVSSLEPLRGLTALQTLDLSGTKVADLEPLKGLTALQALDLSRTRVADLEPLKGLIALQALDLTETKVADLEPLKGLTTLHSLDLPRTPVEHLEPLKGLTGLEFLGLSGTKVTNLEPLKGLKRLQTLFVMQTKVADLEPLRGLTALQRLILTGTPVASLEPLCDLPHLHLQGTEVISKYVLDRFAACRQERHLPQ
jgi:hypothetical protein